MTRLELRHFFIEKCRRYSNTDHIKSSSLFKGYADKVSRNKYITERSVRHFAKFFTRECRFDVDELVEIFSFLTIPKSTSPTSSLDDFFVD